VIINKIVNINTSNYIFNLLFMSYINIYLKDILYNTRIYEISYEIHLLINELSEYFINTSERSSPQTFDTKLKFLVS